MSERPWWHYVLGAAAIGALAYGIGHAAGAPTPEDALRIKERSERAEKLKATLVVLPTAALTMTQSGRVIYNEAIVSYLSGAPNGAFDNIMKVLEITLRKKHEEITGKPAPTSMDLNKLIEQAQKHLGANKELAHQFRKERKAIHFDKVTSEPYTLAAIFHISNMLNILYPYEFAIIYYTCPRCGKPEQFNLSRIDNHWGNAINNLRCANRSAGIFSININYA